MTNICVALLYYLLVVDIEYQNYYYFCFASLDGFVLLHLYCVLWRLQEEPDDKTTQSHEQLTNENVVNEILCNQL